MGELTLESTFKTSPDIQVRVLDGEAVLLNIQTGAYFGANKVATAIWQHYAEGLSLGKVVESIIERFEVEQPRAEADVMAFTRLMLDKGLLVQFN